MATNKIDNIIIGNLVEGVTLEMLGILDDEVTVTISEDEAHDMDLFLPKILVSIGMFPSTSEIRRIQKARNNMKQLTADERTLWRTLDTPELTKFKVGKKLFWIAVGVFK